MNRGKVIKKILWSNKDKINSRVLLKTMKSADITSYDTILIFIS